MLKDPRLRDFRTFVALVWARLGLPSPTPVQLDIAHFLQHGPRRKVVQAYRGAGKSWLTSAFVAWNLYWHPEWNVMVVSASRARADAFSTFVFQLFDAVPEIAHMKPRSDQRSSKVNFDVSDAPPGHSSSVFSVGITGTMTGSRADLIVGDDIEVPNNSFSDGERAKLTQATKEFESIIKPLDHCGILFLGTPQCEESTYRDLATRGYALKVWPARVPSPEARKGYIGLAEMIEEMCDALPAGTPTDPERFSHEELLVREASMGRSTFALQFQLDTSLSDREKYPLRLTDLVVMGLDRFEGPEKVVWASGPDQKIKDLECVGFKGDCYHRPLALQKQSTAKYEGSVMSIDPSGRGSDETAFAIVKNLYGRLFVTACGGMPGGYEDATLDALLNMARAHGVKALVIESNFGDGIFNKVLQTRMAVLGYHMSIHEERASTQKERRIIDTLEPLMNQHRLVVDHRVIEQDFKSTRHLPPEQALRRQLMYQMSRITKDRGALAHDDRIDALAWGVKYWIDRLGVSPDAQAQNAHDEWIIKEINKEFTHYGINMPTKGFGSRTVGRIPRPRHRR